MKSNTRLVYTFNYQLFCVNESKTFFYTRELLSVHSNSVQFRFTKLTKKRIFVTLSFKIWIFLLVKYFLKLTSLHDSDNYRIYSRISRPAYKSNWKNKSKILSKIEIFISSLNLLIDHRKQKQLVRTCFGRNKVWPSYKSNW